MSKKKDSLKPWLSRPAVNRSVTLPLTRPLTQRLSNLNEFHPNELDPYLLFDAQSSMLGTLEASTLDLDPSDPSTLDVITATRAGTATFTEPDGTIATAPSDTVRVDYTQGEQLTPTVYQNIGYTDFSQDWTIENSTLTESQTTAPDGTTPVYELTENTSTSRHRLYRGFPNIMPLVVGQDYTVSAYVKKVSSGRFFLINSSALNGIKGFLNLDTGVATLTSGTGTIAVTDEGNGWYRLSVTAQATTTNGFVYMQLQNAETDANYTGTGASMLIWGPQFEEGTTATDFVANTTGSPKFTGISATYSARVPMVLIEPSATNLVTHSEDFSEWISENATIESDVIVSPSGSQDGSKMVTSNSVERQGINKAQTESGDLAFSVFAKKSEYDVIQLTDAVNASFYANFNLTSGTIGSYTGYTPKIEPVGNGWFRCSVTFNSATINKVRLTIAEQDNDGRLESFAGNGSDGLYIWGAQLEAGSVSTSYIPTSGSTVTRAADELVISGSSFTDFYNQSEGTFYVEYEPRIVPVSVRDHYVFAAHNGFNYRITGISRTVAQCEVANAGAVQVQLDAGTPIPNQLNRFSVSYVANDFRASLDGGAEVTDNAGAPPTNVNQFWLGDFVGSNSLNGHIKRLIYWPTHSDNL